MFKVIKKMLLAGLLFGAVVAPVRVDAVDLSPLVAKIICMGGGLGFTGLTGLFGVVARKGNELVKLEQKNKRVRPCPSFTTGADIRKFGTVGAILSGIAATFFFSNLFRN